MSRLIRYCHAPIAQAVERARPLARRVRVAKAACAVIAGAVLVAASVLAGCGASGSGDASSESPAAPAYQAWAVGDRGTIIASAGGTRWVPQSSGASADLKSVAFSDSAHGWAVGDGGTIVATTDGGAHWRSQPSGTSDYIQAVACSDSMHAWALANSGDGDISTTTILATADGGTSWTTQFSTTGPGSGAGVAFADSLHGWAVSDDAGTILTTSDGGRKWRAVDASRWVSGGVVLHGVACSDARRVWVVGMAGGGFPRSLILASSDGGATWVEQHVRTRQPLYSVFFIDAAHGWVTPMDATLRATVDGGKTWQMQGAPGLRREFVHQVAFTDTLRGWALAGADIRQTSDGGRTWTEQLSGVEQNLVGIACVKNASP